MNTREIQVDSITRRDCIHVEFDGELYRLNVDNIAHKSGDIEDEDDHLKDFLVYSVLDEVDFNKLKVSGNLGSFCNHIVTNYPIYRASVQDGGIFVIFETNSDYKFNVER